MKKVFTLCFLLTNLFSQAVLDIDVEQEKQIQAIKKAKEAYEKCKDLHTAGQSITFYKDQAKNCNIVFKFVYLQNMNKK